MTSDANHNARYGASDADSEMSFEGLGSDIESSEASRLGANDEFPDYWLGKKCFEFFVAEAVVRNNPNSISMEDLDVSHVKH